MPPVMLIVIDGLRPDALTAIDLPYLTQLRRQGSWALAATSVVPPITLPCLTSIICSAPPARHGVLTNEHGPTDRVGLLDHVHAHGAQVAALYNWEPLRDLGRPGALGVSLYRCNADDPDGDRVLAGAAAWIARHEVPDLMLLYLGTLDTVGHETGWMSDAYLAQLRRVDAALGVVLRAVLPEGTVLVTSDHGGHDCTHGLAIDEDMLVPWIVAGPGIRRDHEIAGPVSLLDTAPTLARLCGVAPHPEWEGHPLTEIWAAGEPPEVWGKERRIADYSLSA